MELVWGIYYAVLKDGSLIVDQYLYTVYETTLRSSDEKD